MTRRGLKDWNNVTSSCTLSASTCAVGIVTLYFSLSSAAILSHLDCVRLAIMNSVNMSVFWASLCATTAATPPAPMMRTLLDIIFCC